MRFFIPGEMGNPCVEKNGGYPQSLNIRDYLTMKNLCNLQNVSDYADRPNVAGLVVFGTAQDFWRHIISREKYSSVKLMERVLRRVAGGLERFLDGVVVDLLREAEVRQLENAGIAELAVQQVLGLDV